MVRESGGMNMNFEEFEIKEHLKKRIIPLLFAIAGTAFMFITEVKGSSNMSFGDYILTIFMFLITLYNFMIFVCYCFRTYGIFLGFFAFFASAFFLGLIIVFAMDKYRSQTTAVLLILMLIFVLIDVLKLVKLIRLKRKSK